MNIKNILVTVAVGIASVLPLSAQINPAFRSFGTTNGLAHTDVYTNQLPTNAIAMSVGHAIALPNADKVLLYFSGSNSTPNVGNFVFNLVRSGTATPAATNDFETTPILGPYVVTMNGSNVVTWMTNLDTYAIGAISSIGVYSISNTAAAGNITNFTFGIYTKTIPIRYP